MNGVELIAAERQRQIEVEGWAPEHDDEHDGYEMSAAAKVYCDAARLAGERGKIGPELWRRLAQDFPWEPKWCKPSDDPIRNLVKAGALIAAEIDRLTRAAVIAKMKAVGE